MFEYLPNIVVIVFLAPVVLITVLLMLQVSNNISRNMSSSNAGTSMSITDMVKQKLGKQE